VERSSLSALIKYVHWNLKHENGSLYCFLFLFYLMTLFRN
jgi:hypothetical protein